MNYLAPDIQSNPGRVTQHALSWMLFAICIALYVHVSAVRHAENSEDRIVPNATQLWQGVRTAVLQPAEENDDGSITDATPLRQRITHSMIWGDTVASSRRFFISLALLVPGVMLGMYMGLFPRIHAVFLRFVLFFDKIVALSLLPILFIVFGIDEWSKIMLIVIGVGPTMTLDTCQIVKAVPREQIVKSFTLGATNTDVTYRVVFKQILPQIINSLRLNLKPMMLFLFAGEMIASTDGLAYRIAIMRRHMGMDIIIPYLLWVALLLYLFDWFLRFLNRRLHPWY